MCLLLLLMFIGKGAIPEVLSSNPTQDSFVLCLAVTCHFMLTLYFSNHYIWIEENSRLIAVLSKNSKTQLFEKTTIY